MQKIAPWKFNSKYLRNIKLPTLVKLLTFVVFLATTMQAQAQEALLDRKISIDLYNVTLKEAFRSLEELSDVKFIYAESFTKYSQKKITLKKNAATVRECIEYFLRDTRLTFTLVDDQVIIQDVGRPESPQRVKERGSIKGRVVEFETSEPLPGATLMIPELQAGTLADEKGYYQIDEIPEGQYVLQVSFVGFTTVKIPFQVKDRKEINIDAKLASNDSLGEVIVSGTRVVRGAVTHTSDAQIIHETKLSSTVISGISSEQISKLSDRNAAEVVRRVPGVVLQDEKFVINRGMDPRYNLLYINDNIAPATELYTRSFSLDLIPSRIIDRVIVYKSPSPDLLGDMTSGAVKIFTKDSKALKHIDLELQLGYREGTTGNKNFLTYQGGKYDFLGFDDGSRALPEVVPSLGDLQRANISQETYVKSFSANLGYGRKTALPNGQATVNFYNSFRLGAQRLSSVASLNYKMDLQQNKIYRWQGGFNGRQFDETQATQNAQINLLWNFSLRLRDSTEIQFKNFLLQQGQSQTVTRMGIRTYGLPTDPRLEDYLAEHRFDFTKDNFLSFSQRFLYAGNLGAKRVLQNGRAQVQGNFGYTYSLQDIPDLKGIHLNNTTVDIENSTTTPQNGVANYETNWLAYVRGSQDDYSIQRYIDFGAVSRIWIRDENFVYNGTLDYSWKLTPELTVKAGTFHQWKEKIFNRRIYLVNDGALTGGYTDYNSYVGQNGYVDFNVIGFNEQDVSRLWSTEFLRDDGSGLKVYDKTSGSDAYLGTEQNNSGYISAQANVLDQRLDIYGGLRVEYDHIKLGGAIPPNRVGEVNVPVLVSIPKTSFLPSLNLAFRPTSSWVLRAAYGRTLNRPEFREIAPYRDIDYVNNQYVFGNTDLKPALIDNFDMRLEWYPSEEPSASISVGAFYKKLSNPIERVTQTHTVFASAPIITFENASTATLRGIEADMRLKPIRDLTFFANAALIKSEVTFRFFNRPLQGQSPYILNTGFMYDRAGTGTRISLTYNISGPRIYAASANTTKLNGAETPNGDTGPAYRGSLIELPRHQLDFSISQRVVKTLQVRINIQNILNEPVRFAEDNNYTWKYEKYSIAPAIYNSDGSVSVPAKSSGDHIASQYNPMRYVTLVINYSF